MSSALDQALARLAEDRPIFHTEDTEHTWSALPGTLALLARLVVGAERTLEVGCGASTVLFAAAGSTHISISPDPAEHEQVRSYCTRIGLDPGSIEFMDGLSDEVLPRLDPRLELDFAFIDGDHSFPHPAVDWHYVNKHLKVGGMLLVDDMPTPAVATIGRKMRGSPDWELIESADARAAAFRKLGHRVYQDFREDPFNLAPSDYGFLEGTDAVRQTIRDRVSWTRGALGRRYPGLKRAARRIRR